MPSMTRLAPSPLTDFSSKAPLWRRQGRCSEPHVCHQAHQNSAGRHNDFFGSTFEAVVLCPTQGNREVTPSSNKEAPSDIAAHYA
jgi:hypothetical protein